MIEPPFISGSFDPAKFYFADWTAMFLQFLSIWALAHKNILGFVLAFLSSICWMLFGLMTGSVADITAQVVFMCMNAYAFSRWKKQTPVPVPESL